MKSELYKDKSPLSAIMGASTTTFIIFGNPLFYRKYCGMEEYTSLSHLLKSIRTRL
jgi:hypothetical protein